VQHLGRRVQHLGHCLYRIDVCRRRELDRGTTRRATGRRTGTSSPSTEQRSGKAGVVIAVVMLDFNGVELDGDRTFISALPEHIVYQFPEGEGCGLLVGQEIYCADHDGDTCRGRIESFYQGLGGAWLIRIELDMTMWEDDPRYAIDDPRYAVDG
jgi:hypothetical protein